MARHQKRWDDKEVDLKVALGRKASARIGNIGTYFLQFHLFLNTKPFQFLGQLLIQKNCLEKYLVMRASTRAGSTISLNLDMAMEARKRS